MDHSTHNDDSLAPSRSRLEQSAWLAVVQAYQVCTRQYTRMLATFDLTVAQFDAMTRIQELGAGETPVTPHDIAEAMLVTRGNLTGLLRRLQQHGLVQTEPNPDDGRSVVCRLTPAGETLLARAKRASAAFITAQLEPFSDQSLQHTRGQMQKMAAHLDTLDPLSFAVGYTARKEAS